MDQSAPGIAQGINRSFHDNGDGTFSEKVSLGPGVAQYHSPRGTLVQTNTTEEALFSDDFGGSAIDPTKWDVLDGGLGANVNLGYGILAQAAIGSGVTGMTDAVSNSGLAVSMNTTASAERWYLSKQAFAGKEDILVILSKSQALAANSIFVGLVEVDPATLVPLLNPNLAGDFTNRGGVQFGGTTTTTAYHCEAVADSSSSVASGVTGVASAWTAAQECLIEIDSRDITAQTAAVDALAGKLAGGSRVSTQCPNDQKLYKLLIRFLNSGAPASNTTVTIQRIIVIDNYEQRVQVSTAEGDNNLSKALAVNLVGANILATTTMGSVTLGPIASAAAPLTIFRLTAAASTNGTLVKAARGTICGGYLRNRAAYEIYFKFYNKSTAPTVGTDTPVLTIGLAPGTQVGMADIAGAAAFQLGVTGIGIGITKAYADSDTTAVAAGDGDIQLIYV